MEWLKKRLPQALNIIIYEYKGLEELALEHSDWCPVHHTILLGKQILCLHQYPASQFFPCRGFLSPRVVSPTRQNEPAAAVYIAHDHSSLGFACLVGKRPIGCSVVRYDRECNLVHSFELDSFLFGLVSAFCMNDETIALAIGCFVKQYNFGGRLLNAFLCRGKIDCMCFYGSSILYGNNGDILRISSTGQDVIPFRNQYELLCYWKAIVCWKEMKICFAATSRYLYVIDMERGRIIERMILEKFGDVFQTMYWYRERLCVVFEDHIEVFTV